MINNSGMSNPNAVIKISVDSLFDNYTYEIPDPTMEHADLSRLLILYGENGSGKTTILKLLYNILSTARQKGHRTYLARQLFKRFAVELADGTCIAAEREGDRLDGSFNWSVTKGNEILAEVHLPVNERKAVAGRLPDDLEKKHSDVIETLSKLDMKLYFLSDDRKILGRTEEEKETDYFDYIMEHEEIGERLITRHRISRDKYEGLPLEDAIANLVEWIRNQVRSGSSLGETNVNTIYSEVVKRIAKYPSDREAVTHHQVEQLLNTVDDLTTKNKEFSELGLLPPLNTEVISNILREPPEETEAIIYNVLKPYVDGIKARFDALEEIKDSINTFLHNINDFYVNKSVKFDLSQGLKITSARGQDLSPSILSSGEKQLLLLFCHTLAAREQSSIVIIDEPEISLNVTWQRKLIHALLECAGSSNFQLLLSTHSMELLTQHKQHVVKLNNLASRR